MSQRRHQVLVVGVGSIGERHTRCFLATGRADVSIVEPNGALRAAIADRYSIARAWSSIDEVPAGTFDAVVIATPAPTHIAIAMKLAASGIHLLIEKPLSTSLAGVDDLRQLVAERRLTAAVAYVHRAHPALAEMRQQIATGRFGEPVHLVAVTGQHFPTYRPAYRQTYYTNHATGGGAVQDALTHVLNAGQWLVGPIDRLVADAAHLILDGVDVEDTVHVIARHGTIPATYSLNQHQAPNEFTITVNCRRGTARYEMHESRWRWMIEPSGAWHDEPAASAKERDVMFIRQATVFLDSIEGTAKPLCSLEDGIRTLHVNLAVLESWREKQWRSIQEIK